VVGGVNDEIQTNRMITLQPIVIINRAKRVEQQL
jgi:hypothetical protein